MLHFDIFCETPRFILTNEKTANTFFLKFRKMILTQAKIIAADPPNITCTTQQTQLH